MNVVPLLDKANNPEISKALEIFSKFNQYTGNCTITVIPLDISNIGTLDSILKDFFKRDNLDTYINLHFNEFLKKIYGKNIEEYYGSEEDVEKNIPQDDHLEDISFREGSNYILLNAKNKPLEVIVPMNKYDHHSAIRYKLNTLLLQGQILQGENSGNTHSTIRMTGNGLTSNIYYTERDTTTFLEMCRGPVTDHDTGADVTKTLIKILNVPERASPINELIETRHPILIAGEDYSAYFINFDIPPNNGNNPAIQEVFVPFRYDETRIKRDIFQEMVYRIGRHL
ncbi:MAG: hypothetical protein ACP5NV_02650 [Candidatus Woesearchaeota archaeon]